jgi:hypothetical protein
MKRFLTLGLALVLILGAAQQSAHADTALVSGSWVVLDQYGPDGGSMLNNYFTGGPWTWSGTGTLYVTDLFVIGDGYTIYDNGVAIDTMPVPVPDYSSLGYSDPYGSGNYTTDASTAYLDGRWATATIDLGAGDHSFTFLETSIPTGFTDGTIAFGVDIPGVPAPPSLLLLGSGLIGLAGARLRGRWRK